MCCNAISFNTHKCFKALWLLSFSVPFMDVVFNIEFGGSLSGLSSPNCGGLYHHVCSYELIYCGILKSAVEQI